MFTSVTVIAVLGAAPMASAGTGPAHSRPTIAANMTAAATAQKSAYWAGYVATAPANQQDNYFKRVTTTFTVPAISRCSFHASVSQYAGLSGYWVPGGNPLQAAGVYETCTLAPGHPVYYGAYWNVPDNGASNDQPGDGDGPTKVFPVHPGDVIFASVSFDGPNNCGVGCQQYDTWQVTDNTTGRTWKKKLACLTDDVSEGEAACDTNTAEVISQGEPNSLMGEAGEAGTPPFGKINFKEIQVTDHKQASPHAMVSSGWTTTKVAEYGTVTFKPDVTPGSLTSTTTQPAESAFTNTWKRLN